MVRELHLPHMESLVPDVAVVGCRGEERRESPLGKAGGAHVRDQGGPLSQRCRSSATSLRPRLWVMGEWGISSKVSRKHILHHAPVECVRIRPFRFCGPRNGPTDAG